MELNHYIMEDVLESLIDYRGKTPKKSDEGIPALSAKSVKNGYIDYNECYYISHEEYKRFMVRGFPKVGDVLLTTEAPMGMVARLDRDDVGIAQRLLTLRGREGVLDNDYLLYYLQSPIGQHKLAERETGSTVTGIKQAEFRKIEIDIPDIEIQRKIAAVLNCIDLKIEKNKHINRNLSEQALAIYHKMFVETDNDERTTCRTEEFFDITIGKTPPRKEKEWFSENPEDCVWISISDMGSCGTFITDSSEYLTQAAVEKHNVKVVPDNTVILSFKLTVGRIAITVGETTTNEAIAHFNTNKDNITEYLYCYLKSFDFGSLGSTSSIGTAVNSKTIKAMDFVIPGESELQEFCDIARPMFEQIKKNQFENQNLITMRDSLLPKLMSGELDVSDLNI